jgi:predicted XRE-type DNA-binding protein
MTTDSDSDLRRLTAENTALRDALTIALANLVGANSAYRQHASRHRSVGRARVDPFYTTRIADFEKAEREIRALAGDLL